MGGRMLKRFVFFGIFIAVVYLLLAAIGFWK